MGDVDPLLPQTLTPSHDDDDDDADNGGCGGAGGDRPLFGLSLTPLECDSDGETVSIVRSVRGKVNTGGGSGNGRGKD